MEPITSSNTADNHAFRENEEGVLDASHINDRLHTSLVELEKLCVATHQACLDARINLLAARGFFDCVKDFKNC